MSVIFPHLNEDNFNPQQQIMQYVRYNKPFNICMKIKEKVLAQDDAVRQASVLVYAYLRSLAYGNYEDRKYHFMIEAESGCGKSTFAKALRSAVQIPVIICDASQVTGAGWKGCDAADLLANDELERWGCGIIILDELDKAIMPQGGNAEHHHRFVQESFLKMLDGGAVPNKDGKVFDCDRYLFIGMGAFSPMRVKKAEPRSIGFGVTEPAKASTKTNQITRDYITEVCGSEQFMGRFVSVLHFQKLGISHYKIMAKNVVDEICETYGFWELPEAEEERILRCAIESPYGARNIRNEVWNCFMTADSAIIREMKRQESIEYKMREDTFPDEDEHELLIQELLRAEGLL